MTFLARLAPLHKRIVTIIIAMALVAAAGFGIYRYVMLVNEVSRLRASPQGVQEAAKTEALKIADQVGKLIAVPAGETPTIATVSDVEKLKTNAFFIHAQNGDKLLIYTEAKRAIIFRPGENKIIEVGPINIGSSSAATVQNMTFALYNGTDVTGLTKKYETTLTGLVKNATVADRDNAKKRDYETSLLVDLTGAKAGEAAELAKTLGIPLGPLPEGETKPVNADFLIILGADKK